MRDFPLLSRPALGPNQWIPGLSRGQRAARAWRWPLTSSSAAVKKEYSCTSTLPVGRTACTEPQGLYKGTVYLFTLPLILQPGFIKTNFGVHPLDDSLTEYGIRTGYAKVVHRYKVCKLVLLHRTALYRVFLVRCSSFNNHLIFTTLQSQ